MLQCEIFIFKLVSVDRFSSSAIVISEITTLAHEVWYYTMENASLITNSFFSCTQCAEIFRSFWYDITAELKSVDNQN